MPVQIGAKAHSFSEPTGLLSDCHRRIEMFLATLERAASVVDTPLAEDTRAALESALRYFREAAPKHTEDEEQSLFPRLRQISNPEMEAAIRKLDPLEKEHRRADTLHAEVHELGTRCLREGSLPTLEANQFRYAISQLVAMYKEHIRIEDELVFPIAGRLLSKTDKDAIAEEMAGRRR